MYWKLILGLAASVFLAFSDLSPAVLLATDAPRASYVESYFGGAGASFRSDRSSALNDDVPALATTAAAATAVEVALGRIGDRVMTQSHSEALRYAFRAYYNYKSTYPTRVRNPYLYFVDFGFDSLTPRGYVFNMESLTVVAGPFSVAHGRGSVPEGSQLPTRFLNSKGSNATSLGLYLAQETYSFSGKSGGRAYRSIGLRLQGVSGRFNDMARERGIVVHGAPYVTKDEAGRSEGCPAMEPELAAELIPQIANGGLVFLFSPLDRRWMQEDRWAALPEPTLARMDAPVW